MLEFIVARVEAHREDFASIFLSSIGHVWKSAFGTGFVPMHTSQGIVTMFTSSATAQGYR